MPQYNYSPWQSAADSFSGIGPSMNAMNMQLVRARYEQAVRQQQLGMALARLQMQQQMNEARIPQIRASGLASQARAQMDQQKMESAGQLGVAARGMVPRADYSQGPTVEAASALNLGDLYQQAARSGALAGHGMQMILPQHVGANQIAYQPMTGQPVAMGPQVVGAGQTYTAPGMQPQYGLEKLSQGQVVVDPNTGQTLGQGLPPRPQADARLGGVASSVAALYGPNAVQPGWNPSMQTPPTPLQVQQFTAYTNLLNQLNQHLSQGQTQPNQIAPTPQNSAAGLSPTTGRVRKYNPLTDNFE